MLKRNVARYIVLAWVGYLIFVFVSDFGAFGLTVQSKHTMKWLAARLATFTAWLLVSLVLLKLCKYPADWNSFLAGLLATALAAVVVLPSLIPDGSNYLAVGLSVGFYGLVSGFMCITVRKTAHAALYGLLLLPAQIGVDGTAHLLSGVFRLH